MTRAELSARAALYDDDEIEALLDRFADEDELPDPEDEDTQA